MALSVARVNQLKQLQEYLGISFRDLNLLNMAFCHKSYTKEQKHQEMEDNERLEFLGDAVLKLVVSEYIYKKFPEKHEGDLTKIRAGVISDSTLSRIANEKKLGNYLLLSNNEKQSGGDTRKSNVANMMEALFGAYFLDSGIDPIRQLIIKLLAPVIEESLGECDLSDYKSMLQERAQSLGWKLPEYRVIQEIGPEHDKTFLMQVKVGKGLKKFKEEGSGHTKKEAEQAAARLIYSKITANQGSKA